MILEMLLDRRKGKFCAGKMVKFRLESFPIFKTWFAFQLKDNNYNCFDGYPSFSEKNA